MKDVARRALNGTEICQKALFCADLSPTNHRSDCADTDIDGSTISVDFSVCESDGLHVHELSHTCPAG